MNAAGDPAQHGLRAAHGSHQERDGDEGPDPNHVGNVQGRGMKQTEGARQMGLRFSLHGARTY